LAKEKVRKERQMFWKTIKNKIKKAIKKAYRKKL
jgi:hypothetical protein